MKDASPTKIFLKDYTPPLFHIPKVSLAFYLYEEVTTVVNRMEIQAQQDGQDLILNGEKLKLKALRLNGHDLAPQNYKLTDENLTIIKPPHSFTLELVTEIEPQNNTSLEGLYKSGGGFCTQNEPEGFRKITYFLDRPDVMSKYDVLIEADQKKYPILLSNGNPIERKNLGNGRHQVLWRDPHPKPSYLMALVAGDYDCLKDEFITHTGKHIQLEIYCAHGFKDRCRHAMESLKRSMRWDEEHFGREYDLDLYMILAVDDFNAGAMENKGLNIFNSRLIFANEQTATDTDYETIEAVIAHEYFHNWTGNRITLRDWFHLSLKEGLTVFRDQQYTADQTSASLKRIDDVQTLRDGQFAEDAGPNSHPVRPDSCYAVDNFFTATIYEKGAEVIRMIYVLLGKDGFRRGMDHYFDTYDGQAVTIEDFVHSFETTNNIDLSQFKRWYNVPGTPLIEVQESYDSSTQTYTLTLTQDRHEAFHIPIAMGLMNDLGHDILPETTRVLELKEKTQSFSFNNISQKPTLSLIRNFSAPVNLKWERPESEILFAMAHDSDGFSRWDSMQMASMLEIKSALRRLAENRSPQVSDEFTKAFQKILEAWEKDPALTAKLLQLPSSSVVIQQCDVFIPENIHKAFLAIEASLGEKYFSSMQGIYQNLYRSTDPTKVDATSAGRRALMNELLKYMCVARGESHELAMHQFKNSRNMTEEQGALTALNHTYSPLRREALDRFFAKWQKESLVLNKWFILEALHESANTLERVQQLVQSPHFKISNPNNCYSLLGRFGWENLTGFHKAQSYAYFADMLIKIDGLNPQVAARLAEAFETCKKLEPVRREQAYTQIEKVLKHPGLSKNTYELIKNMAQPAE